MNAFFFNQKLFKTCASKLSLLYINAQPNNKEFWLDYFKEETVYACISPSYHYIPSFPICLVLTASLVIYL